LLTMAEHYGRIANQHFDNRLHPFPLTPPQLNAHLYWHTHMDADPTNRWFRQQVIKAVQDELTRADRLSLA